MVLTPRVFTPANRMNLILGGGSDPTANDLAQNAERRVAGLKQELRVYVGVQVSIIANVAKRSEEVIFAESRTLRNAALAISEVAGSAGMTAVGEAARGIYIMMEAQTGQGVWHTDALRIHIKALMSLQREPDIAPAAAEAVLDELKQLRDWIGVQD